MFCALSAAAVLAAVPALAGTSSTATSADDLADIQKAIAADAIADTGPPPVPGVAPRSFQSILPDIAVILDVAFAHFTADENLQRGGHDPTANGFTLQQVELSLSGAVDPYFRYDSNIVFSLDGVEVEEAYATTTDLPFGLQVRAGQFLTRFGRFNPTHLHAWAFLDQPFAIGRVFGGEGNRGPGVELSWLSPLPWYVELLVSGTMPAGEGTTRSFIGEADLGLRGPQDLEYVTALKQAFPIGDDLTLLVGLSWATAPNASGLSYRTNVFGADLYLKYRPITEASDLIVALTAEALFRKRQLPGDDLSDTSLYVQAELRPVRRWQVAARWEYGGPARGSEPETIDDLDPDWTGARHKASASVSFTPTEFSRLRLQGSGDFPAWRADPIWAVMFALEIAIGAHGAHRF